MRVRDTMTPNPITIAVTETLQGAMELMARKHIRHLPVVDASGTVLGLVTDRDLRRAAPSPLFAGDAQEAMEQATVERVMVRAPTGIGIDAPIEEALRIFVDKKYGALLVLDAGKRLVGILTPIDVMRRWLEAAAAKK